MIGTNRYIGSPVERIEDLRFLRGRREFVGDLQRGVMLHAAILRGPIDHVALAGLAEDGVGAIVLDVEELPPVADRRVSGRHEILVFEESGTNLAMTFTGVLGDAEAAFRDAPYVRRECFEVQRHTALPMEPRGL